MRPAYRAIIESAASFESSSDDYIMRRGKDVTLGVPAQAVRTGDEKPVKVQNTRKKMKQAAHDQAQQVQDQGKWLPQSPEGVQ